MCALEAVGEERRSPSARPRAAGGPLAAASLGAVCICATAILVRLAHTGAATVAFYSCLFALPALAGVAVPERMRHGPRRTAARLAAAVAGLLLGVDLVLWNHAIAAVGAGIATVLGALHVPFVALAAWMLLGERPNRGFAIALPVLMAGVVLVSGVLGGAMAGGRPVAGIVFSIGSAAAYAAFLLTLRQTSTGSPHVAGPLADATGGAAIGSLLLGLAFGGLPLAIPSRRPPRPATAAARRGRAAVRWRADRRPEPPGGELTTGGAHVDAGGRWSGAGRVGSGREPVDGRVVRARGDAAG